MAKVKGAITVNTVRCKGCNLCVVACPTDTLALSPDVNDRGYHFAYMANPDYKKFEESYLDAPYQQSDSNEIWSKPPICSQITNPSSQILDTF